MNRPVNEPQASKKVPSPRKAPEMNRKQAKIGHIKEKNGSYCAENRVLYS